MLDIKNGMHCLNSNVSVETKSKCFDLCRKTIMAETIEKEKKKVGPSSYKNDNPRLLR